MIEKEIAYPDSHGLSTEWIVFAVEVDVVLVVHCTGESNDHVCRVVLDSARSWLLVWEEVGCLGVLVFDAVWCICSGWCSEG